MRNILFALPGNAVLTKQLAFMLNAEIGQVNMRQFPDGESYVQVISDVKDKKSILVCTLHEPNEKLLSLYFLSKLLKDLGVKSTCLVAPYLAYMRQDKRFQVGEAVTSEYVGKFISEFVDSLITIDPHLHHKSSLSEIYSVPTHVKHAANLISNWIKLNVMNPILVGPDRESEQWVSEVAKNANAPYIVLDKIRHGDNDVEISIPQVDKYKNHTPVLVDDIISTARTMIETVVHLKKAKMKAPVCVGVHAVFSGNAFENLKKSGVEKIITCNTIPHQTNKIDISNLLYTALISNKVNEL